MAGRKPLPPNVKIFRGNPGKRPLNGREPRPGVRRPPCPDHIQGRARKEWYRTSRKLYRAGLLTEIDGPALAAYCEEYVRWAEGTVQVSRFGMIVKSPGGYPMPSPFLSIIKAALAQMKGFMVEQGVIRPDPRTPTGRTPELSPRTCR